MTKQTWLVRCEQKLPGYENVQPRLYIVHSNSWQEAAIIAIARVQNVIEPKAFITACIDCETVACEHVGESDTWVYHPESKTISNIGHSGDDSQDRYIATECFVTSENTQVVSRGLAEALEYRNVTVLGDPGE
ncbi:MAG: hypothetical protein GY774_33750 [Planctomycetes bacterium]|nr:hypothetical protein [Planctomycetota bacterium]